MRGRGERLGNESMREQDSRVRGGKEMEKNERGILIEEAIIKLVRNLVLAKPQG